MVTILILIFVLVAGYLTTHFLLDRLKSRYLVAGGLEYMLLGIMAGAPAAQLYASVAGWFKGAEVEPVTLIGPEVVASLSPAITLGIGSIGLLAGLRLSFRRKQDGFEFEDIRASLVINIITALLVGFVSLGLLLYFAGDFSFFTSHPVPDGWPWASVRYGGTFQLERLLYAAEPLMPMVLLLTATAIVSASTPIAYTVARYHASGRMSHFVVKVAELSEVMGILVFGIVFSIAHPDEVAFGRSLTAVEWLVNEVAVGVIVGLLFTLFLGNEEEDEKLLVAVIGIIVFASGVSYYLKLSPIFVNFFVGLTVANTSRYHQRLLKGLEKVEKPFYIVLYFFAGVAWVPFQSWWVLTLIPLYMGVRFVGKWLGGRAAAATGNSLSAESGGGAPNRALHVRGIGTALMAQGGLSVAMVLNYVQVYGPHAELGTTIVGTLLPDESILEAGVTSPDHNVTALLTTIILASVLINELTAFRATRNVLINAGEIDPKDLLPPEDMYAHDEEPLHETAHDEPPDEPSSG